MAAALAPHGPMGAMQDEPGLTGATPLSEGDMVAGRYRIVNELGRGGYAIVYKALDLRTQEHIALKTIRPIAPRPQEVVARFRREAELISRLRHPNTVRVYDFGFDTDLYIAMELLVGYPVSDILDGVRGIPPRRAIAIARGVLESLTEAHALGIVHRDLKPENIYLVQLPEGGELVKVLDFGIAKSVYEPPTSPNLTLRGRAMGTPTYMSPEQAKGAELTIQFDIYAVSVLIYELICGVPPFQGDSAMDIMLKHVNEPPPGLTVPALRGSPIEWAILKGLSKKPADRFKDAHDYLAALGGTAVRVAGAAPQARPLPPDEPRAVVPRPLGLPKSGFGSWFHKKE